MFLIYLLEYLPETFPNVIPKVTDWGKNYLFFACNLQFMIGLRFIGPSKNVNPETKWNIRRQLKVVMLE